MAKGTLTQEGILRTALELVDSGGLASLSIRQLAAGLGVTPMAIYRHYPNKAAIERDLVDLVVGDFAVTSHDEKNLDGWLLETFLRMRTGLCRHPGIISLLERGLYTGPNALAVMEEVLARLRDSGKEAGEATGLFYTLIAFTIGSVVLGNAEELTAQAAGKTAKGVRQKKKKVFAGEELFRQGVVRVMSQAVG